MYQRGISSTFFHKSEKIGTCLGFHIYFYCALSPFQPEASLKLAVGGEVVLISHNELPNENKDDGH